MSSPSPFYIANLIVNDGMLGDKYIRLTDEIENVLLGQLSGCSETLIAEWAESLEKDVFYELEKINDKQQLHGVEPLVCLDGIPGTAYVRLNNLQLSETLGIIQDLSPIDFVNLCVIILESIGAKAWNNDGPFDGGVDFIAENIPISTIQSVAFSSAHPFLLGQAKHYKKGNFVTLSEVREFLGAAELYASVIRSDRSRIGLFSPIIYAYWTSSEFNHHAIKFAHDVGLWVLNGVSIAQLILKVGLKYDRDKRIYRLPS